MADDMNKPAQSKRSRKAAAEHDAAAATPDHGAAAAGAATTGAADAMKETFEDAKTRAKDFSENWREQTGTMADQAMQTARSAAATAKDTTGSALHGLSKLIADTAETVDGRLGPQYGDYARQAAETVAGAARHLDEKDIDELTAEARNFVRKSPAVAIGAAALVGFVLMRLARGSSNDKS